MIDGRKRTTILAALFVLAGSLGLQAASPAAADPDIDTVKQRVEKLYGQAERASERYNGARVQLTESKVRLRSLAADVSQQQRVVDDMRNDVAKLVVDQYQGNYLSTASQLVFSDSPQSFLDNLSAASSFDSQRGQVMKEYAVQLKRLTLRKEAADEQVKALAKTRKVLLTEKQTIDEKAAAAKALLSKLKDKQRLAMMSRSAAPTAAALPNVPASGRAGAAVRYALAQVGDQYVWGASGPSAFDCSGLTMMAWAQAGVGLPHFSQAQMRAGRPVSRSDLKPGDLIFYYSPVSHVSIYIGNGKIVDAANPGAGVRIDDAFSMPFSGAVRPG